MVLKRQRTGGVGVLEIPTETFPVPEGSEERTLGNIKSSLTVIENPSLDGYLGILMAANTLLHEDDTKSFFHAYVLQAYGGVIHSHILHVDIVKSERRSGHPDLYLVLYNNGSRYPVASELPHEVCKISDNEFRRYEATLTFPHQYNTGLTGLVDNMMQLIGQRLTEKGFAYKDGKLVLPETYANIRL